MLVVYIYAYHFTAAKLPMNKLSFFVHINGQTAFSISTNLNSLYFVCIK